jgi:hypothetical protein
MTIERAHVAMSDRTGEARTHGSNTHKHALHVANGDAANGNPAFANWHSPRVRYNPSAVHNLPFPASRRRRASLLAVCGRFTRTRSLDGSR